MKAFVEKLESRIRAAVCFYCISSRGSITQINKFSPLHSIYLLFYCLAASLLSKACCWKALSSGPREWKMASKREKTQRRRERMHLIIISARPFLDLCKRLRRICQGFGRIISKSCVHTAPKSRRPSVKVRVMQPAHHFHIRVIVPRHVVMLMRAVHVFIAAVAHNSLSRRNERSN